MSSVRGRMAGCARIPDFLLPNLNVYICQTMSDHFKIDVKKLSEYCLNEKHPIGKHKAKVFSSALGVTERDAVRLKRIMLSKMALADLTLEFEDQYGKRFSSVIKVDIKDKSAFVKTIWLCRRSEDIFRLITCYIID